MRPLLVLLLVLIALGALVFGLFMLRGEGPKGGTAVQPAPAVPTQTASNTTNLAPVQSEQRATPVESDQSEADDTASNQASNPTRQNSLVGMVVNDKGAPVPGAS